MTKRYRIPFIIAGLSISYGVIFEPNVLCRNSIPFYIFSLSMLFGLLNLNYDWLGDYKK